VKRALNEGNVPDADGAIRGRVLPQGRFNEAVGLVTLCAFVAWPYLFAILACACAG